MMGKGTLRAHRAGNTRTRNFVAVDAHLRSTAGPMGRTGKGRSRKDSDTRQMVKSNLRGGEW